jgi:hypothetical protein
MLRNNTEYGLRVYASKISSTQANLPNKKNTVNADSIKNVTSKGEKTLNIPNNKPNFQPKK